MSKMVNKHYIFKIQLLLILVWGFVACFTTNLRGAVETDTHTYIVCKEEGKLLIIDRKTGQEQVLDVGRYPLEIVIHDGFGYVGNRNSSALNVFHLKTHQIKAQLSIGMMGTNESIQNIILFKGKLYIILTEFSSSQSRIHEIDLKSQRATKIFHLERGAKEIACHQQFIYVINYYSSSISVIDPERKEVIHTIRVGIAPRGIVFHGQFAYVANLDSHTVSVINLKTHTLYTSIPFDRGLAKFLIYEDVGYSVNWDQDAVQVIDLQTHSVIDTIDVGRAPRSIAFHKEMGYVLNGNSNSVSVIDLKKKAVINTFPVKENPRKMVIKGDFGYVKCRGRNYAICVIDLEFQEVVETLVSLVNNQKIKFYFSDTHRYLGTAKNAPLPSPNLRLFKKPFEGIEGFYSEEDADLAFDEFEKAALRKEYKTARHWFMIALSWGDKKAFAVAFKALCHGLWGAPQSDSWAMQFCDGMDKNYLARIATDVDDFVLREGSK